MKLQSMIKGLVIADRRGRFDADITGVAADSRAVRPGNVFVAVRGLTHDGHDHVPEALERGAVAVIAETWKDAWERGAKVDVALVPDSRRALGLIASNFYGQPSRELYVAGVTGTNGKTTVTYLLESIIRSAGRRVGVVGSIEARFDGRSWLLNHTTPGAIELQRTLAEMVKAGVTHAVMEVSSHALDQQRTAGVHFKVAGFTNLSQDHLDYHKTMDTYFEAKARLFSDGLRKSRARGRMAVVNLDDPRGPEILERWAGKALGVSLDPDSDADVVVLDATYGLDGTQARLRTSKGEWDISTPLVGRHNLSNIGVAVGIALALGFSKARILAGLAALERVPGRLERIPDVEGRDRKVFVDYAHSPDALVNVLDALRAHTAGRLWVVFGAGGERDQDKREAMGEAVGARVDGAFLTNDNPRGEDPQAIVLALAAGLEKAGQRKTEAPLPEPGTYVLDLDRQRVIHTAVGGLGPDDVLLVAGKGHEAMQIIGHHRYRFDDREVCRRALEGKPTEELQTVAPSGEAGVPQARSATVQIAVEDVIDEAFEVDETSIEAEESSSATTVRDGDGRAPSEATPADGATSAAPPEATGSPELAEAPEEARPESDEGSGGP